MRSGLGLSGSAEGVLALRTRRKGFGFFPEALRLFGKAFFKGYSLFEAASALHDTTSSDGS
jgi:hypothetical protein